MEQYFERGILLTAIAHLCATFVIACVPAHTPEHPAVQPEKVGRIIAKAKVVNCGEVIAHKSPGTESASGTQAGYVNIMHELDHPKFKPGCPNIKAKVGTRFGIQVLVESHSGLSILPLSTRVTHPEIRNPQTGSAATIDEWNSPMNAGIPRYTGWKFDKPWELVRGAWKIEILDGDVVIASQDFNVE